MQMRNKQDHSDEILWVYPPRTESQNWWCRQYGDIEIPERWESLSPGDAFVTRQVKLMGPHWVAKKRAKGYTKTLGIWAPKENIEAAQKLAEETRAQREANRVISRAARERQEVKYQEQFAEAVYKYLGFAPRHEKLARDIARGVAEHATQVGSDRVGRTRKLPLEEKAMLAARAYIRNNYTKYEDRLLNSEFPLESGDYLCYRGIKSEANEAVDKFLSHHQNRR
ncbi:MAG: hypothetical protein DDT27_00707 [Dehalococcoidia bacterium]|nr:hypothetical protein [Chloroflexota bacterium]